MAAVSLHNALVASDRSPRDHFRAGPPSPASSSSQVPRNSRPFPSLGDPVHTTFASAPTDRQRTHDRHTSASTSNSNPRSSLSHTRARQDSLGVLTVEAHTAESSAHQALLSPRSREEFARMTPGRESGLAGTDVERAGRGVERPQNTRTARRRKRRRLKRLRIVLELIICESYGFCPSCGMHICRPKFAWAHICARFLQLLSQSVQTQY
jgi:RNA polymerase-binding transcription factor DksA